MPTRRKRCAFTLVELMIVFAIIGFLVALLLPALQVVREAARKATCANNLKQIVLAVQNYESSAGSYPPAFCWNGVVGDTGGNWSVHARILPYLEQENVAEQADMNRRGFDRNISELRISVFQCPSSYDRDARTLDKEDGRTVYPLNYAMNMGVWFVFDPVTKKTGQGVFVVNGGVSDTSIKDGATNTMCAAEVLGWDPYYHDAARGPKKVPVNPEAICKLGGVADINGDQIRETGHADWVNGRVHQTGFTTAFRPNAEVFCFENGRELNVDWTSQFEGTSLTVPTYAAVTARSEHSGVVCVAFMDGRVASVGGSDRSVWRGMSTIAGGEAPDDHDGW